jgi:CRISPR-associated protein Csm1
MNNEGKAAVLGVLLGGIEACRRALGGEAAGREEWREELGRCCEVDLMASSGVARWVELAGRLAAGGEAAASEVSPRLRPVFDNIELEGSHAPPPRRFQLRRLTATTSAAAPALASLSADAPGASGAPEVEERDALRQAFEAELEQLRRRLRWEDFDCVQAHLLHVLQAYGWCLAAPSHPAGTGDISIYDHTRVAAAIAACLSQESAGGFLLLAGGIYGIQDYIYDISTIGAGGVAKRLRARSFYVQLLVEAACLRVLREFGLPATNLLMASGGRFYLLLPNVADAGDRLERLQREFDRRTIERFHGVLAIKLARTEMTEADFDAGRFGDALARAHAALRREQSHWFRGALQDGEGWTDAFIREPFGPDQTDCKACHRFPATKNADDPRNAGADICDQCAEQQQLGRKLTRAEYISFHEDGRGEIECLGLTVTVGDKPEAGAFLAVRLNDPDLAEAARVPAMFRHFANHVPRKPDGAPWTFEEVAAGRELNEGEKGGGLLGVLKADVDWLGTIVQEGLRREPAGAGLDTMTRVAALSRQLDWFFSGWLEWTVKHRFPNCYTVYAGGDDLLLVAAREDSLKLAREIRAKFSDYAGHDGITLSAGIAVVKSRLPLAHTVKEADDALDRAKNAGRNRLCILGDVIAWNALPRLDAEIETLRRCAGDLRTAFLFHLLHAARLRREFEEKHDILALRYHPRLAYQMARNLNPKEQPVLYRWAERLLELPAGASVEQLWNLLPLITQWVLLERRG